MAFATVGASGAAGSVAIGTGASASACVVSDCTRVLPMAEARAVAVACVMPAAPAADTMPSSISAARSRVDSEHGASSTWEIRGRSREIAGGARRELMGSAWELTGSSVEITGAHNELNRDHGRSWEIAGAHDELTGSSWGAQWRSRRAHGELVGSSMEITGGHGRSRGAHGPRSTSFAAIVACATASGSSVLAARAAPE